MDFIVWCPEVFVLCSLLVLLCYGSGVLASPVYEKVSFFLYNNKVSSSNQVVLVNESSGENLQIPAVMKHGIVGPWHVSSHLNSWAITLCLLTLCMIWYSPFVSVQTGGFFCKDLFVQDLQTMVWCFLLLCLAMSHSWLKAVKINHMEYVFLVILFLMGAHLLLMCTDLISLYACLELQSFSVVVLCSLKYTTPYAVEAGIKYFLLSAFSSCLLLLGVGLVFWQTGLTKLSALEELIYLTTTNELLSDGTLLPVWFGLWLIGLALLWKLAAAPLHMWAADVYQGLLASVTLLISTIPKIAVLGFWAHNFVDLWTMAFGNGLAFFSALSMFIGLTLPMAQTNLKRLLLFSSVGHMGFLLMPFALYSNDLSNSLSMYATYGMAALWTYLLLYLVTSLVIWGLMQWTLNRPIAEQVSPVAPSQFFSAQQNYMPLQVTMVNESPAINKAGPQYIWDLIGLKQTSPAALIAWSVALLSLAGLPPVAGFLGKLYLFWASLSANQYLLVLVALVSTLLGCVYYLRLIVVSFVYSKGEWSSYWFFNPMSAYLIVGGLVFLLLGLWYLSPLILASHLLALSS